MQGEDSTAVSDLASRSAPSANALAGHHHSGTSANDTSPHQQQREVLAFVLELCGQAEADPDELLPRFEASLPGPYSNEHKIFSACIHAEPVHSSAPLPSAPQWVQPASYPAVAHMHTEVPESTKP